MIGVWPPERLIIRLGDLTSAITEHRLKLTDAKLGNPKYGMDRRVITDRLEELQNEKIRLLEQYVEWLGGGSLAWPVEGDWVLQITHVGPSPQNTAHARVIVSGMTAHMVRDFWVPFDHELERAIRSIDHLEGVPPRPGRSGSTT